MAKDMSLSEFYAKIADEESKTLQAIKETGDKFIADLQAIIGDPHGITMPNTAARSFFERVVNINKTMIEAELPHLLKQYGLEK